MEDGNEVGGGRDKQYKEMCGGGYDSRKGEREEEEGTSEEDGGQEGGRCY